MMAVSSSYWNSSIDFVVLLQLLMMTHMVDMVFDHHNAAGCLPELADSVDLFNAYLVELTLRFVAS